MWAMGLILLSHFIIQQQMLPPFPKRIDNVQRNVRKQWVWSNSCTIRNSTEMRHTRKTVSVDTPMQKILFHRTFVGIMKHVKVRTSSWSGAQTTELNIGLPSSLKNFLRYLHKHHIKLFMINKQRPNSIFHEKQGKMKTYRKPISIIYFAIGSHSVHEGH